VPSAAPHTATPIPDPPARGGLQLSISVAVLGSAASLSSDYEEEPGPYATFWAAGPWLELRLGGMLGEAVGMGAHLSYTRQWTGAPDFPHTEPPGLSDAPSSTSATLIGPYLSLYPFPSSFWLVTAAAGVGRASFPEFAFTRHPLVSAALSLELAFELSDWSPGLVGALLYRRLGATDLSRESLSTHDLGLAVRYGL
jgi:hypothetical protein